MIGDTLSNILFYAPLAVWLFSTFFFYYRYDKEYKVSFSEKYYKKRVTEDPAAVVSYLIDHKGIGPKDAYATAIDLMQAGRLSFDGGFHVAGEGTDGLLPHQASLLEKLLSGAGGDPDFMTGWIFLVKQDAKEFNYYEPQSFVKKMGLLGSIFYTAIGVVGILIARELRFFVLFIISVITFFHMRKIDKRTREAQADFERCMALKRFLSDYDGSEELEAGVLPFAYSMGILPGGNERLQEKCQCYQDALERVDIIIN